VPALGKLPDCAGDGLKCLLEAFTVFCTSMLGQFQIADGTHAFKSVPNLWSENDRNREDQRGRDRVDQPGKTRQIKHRDQQRYQNNNQEDSAEEGLGSCVA